MRHFAGGVALANLRPDSPVTFQLDSGSVLRRLHDDTANSAPAVEIEIDDTSSLFAVGGGDPGLTPELANVSIVAGQWQRVSDDGVGRQYTSTYWRLNRGRWAAPLEWRA